MRRPYHLTTSSVLPFRMRCRTYATEASAVRHAEEIVNVSPLVVVSIHRRSRDERLHPGRGASAVCGVSGAHTLRRIRQREEI